MRSRGVSFAPNSGTSPLTFNRDSRIQRSTSRREPMPAADKSFCTRSPAGGSLGGAAPLPASAALRSRTALGGLALDRVALGRAALDRAALDRAALDRAAIKWNHLAHHLRPARAFAARRSPRLVLPHRRPLPRDLSPRPDLSRPPDPPPRPAPPAGRSEPPRRPRAKSIACANPRAL